MTERAGEAARLGRGAEAACLAAGFLALGLVPMQAVATPLRALELGASPAEIGLAVGMRSLGPLLFAIHGGALMDRLGAKAVMTRMAALSALACLLIPLVPSVWGLMALQAVFGLAQGLAWVGAQTLVGQWTKGDARLSGRLSAASMLGTFAGPVVAGLAWDAGGAWGAFGAMTLWSGALLAAAAALPRRRKGKRPPARLRDLAPNAADYRAAFALMAAPAVAAVMAGSFARLGAVSVQGSFYPVWLDEIGLDATTIGALVGGPALLAAPAAFLAGPLDRRFGPMGPLTALIAVAVVTMAATPLFTTLPPLAALAAIYGVALGATQAQSISALAKAAPPGGQGLAVGLRTTFNRAGSFVAPVLLGALAEAAGLRAAFLLSGAMLLSAAAAMAVIARRAGLWGRTG